jgi:hypothetical protein
MARKTVSVDFVRDTVNKALATGYCGADVREGMRAVLCEVLHSTGNYRGFRCLTESEVPLGHKPGIRWVDHDDKFDFTDTDDTRVHYF